MKQSLVQQAVALRARFPDASIKLAQKRLDCRCTLQPSSASRTYRVRITYTGLAYPKVRVTTPALDSPTGKSLPHVFNDRSLCLHLDDDWAPAMLIADTIVPWTSEWLFHYEIWRFNDEWYGGGDWPPRRTPVIATGASVMLPDVP